MIKISTSGTLARKMTTDKPRAAEGEAEHVVCSVKVKGVLVDRETMDELCGMPIGVTTHLFRDTGMPFQHMILQLPKRELLATGSIAHKRDSGAVIAELDLKGAEVTNIRFALAAPEKDGPRAAWSFWLTWTAKGDEIDELKDLLGKPCELALAMKEVPGTKPLFADAALPAGVEQVEISQGQLARQVRKAARAQGAKRRGARR